MQAHMHTALIRLQTPIQASLLHVKTRVKARGIIVQG